MTVIIDGTNGVQSVDGSAGTASLTNDGDTNTGIFFPAADTLAVTTAGTERLRLDSAGNMGLGVTPSAWNSALRALQFGMGSLYGNPSGANDFTLTANSYLDATAAFKYVANGFASEYRQSDGKHIWKTAASGTAGNTISFTQAMTLSANGRLSIGSASENAMLYVNGGAIDECIRIEGTGSPYLSIYDSGTRDFYLEDGGGSINYFGTTNKALVFGANNAERARIQSGGTFLVSADGVGSVSFASFNKTGVSDSITTNLFTVTASNNAITGLLEINYAISDPGIETYVGRKVYRLFWNGISALLNAITTEAYGGVEPTFSLTASGATATIRVDFNSGAATYDITVAVSFTPVSTTSSVIAINEA